MRKTCTAMSVVFMLIACMMFTMSCDGGIGLGSQDEITPENIFNGGTWLKDNINLPQYRTKISFTENEFICIYGLTNPETYTGTYKLSQEDGFPYITLSSTETRVTGKILYGQTGEIVDGSFVKFPYPDVISFFPDQNTENSGNIIITGIFYKQ